MTNEISIINCNVGALHRVRLEKLVAAGGGTITQVLTTAINRATGDVNLTEKEKKFIASDAKITRILKGAPKNINCRVPKALHNKVISIARDRRMIISEVP